MWIMKELIEIAFSGFWSFWGMFLLTYIVIRFCEFIYGRTLRTIVLLLRGWPPSGLDADGDFKQQKKY